MREGPVDVKVIFAEALEKASPEEQRVYLDQVCGEDAELRAEVERLLDAHNKAGDFLESSPVGQNVTVDVAPSVEGPGTRIGRYELLELIGEGGMGLVYLAEQREPVKRRVALKIIKPGMDSRQVIARFEAERQTLAVLEHPNIAQVFDAGTTETGRPYFVMEYVRGLSITRYCDERKLDVQERLTLFKDVCEGVQHAHQKGIIHRDLKPSNILISVHGDRAVPKIIDFGIAKAVTQPLTDETVFTCQGQLLGTPEYMSPEQVDLAMQDVDTRSDIYSLGVLLYELLAGVLPFDRESFKHLGLADIQRTIREEEPLTPSTRLTGLGEKAKTIAERRRTQLLTLARCLHRELEWIPMKAMRKDRSRRYRSASELADDIQNYLTGVPLIAGPESSVYRARKFMRKHAGSVSMAALVAVAIILGLVASVVMGCRAEQARAKEAAARTQVEQALVRAEKAERVAKERAEDYRRSLYFNRIALADFAYRDSNVSRLRELLEACPEDLRGWEWHRLSHISDQSDMTLRGHGDVVWSAAFSPNGKRIVSGSADGTIKMWDAATGTEITTIPGHESLVYSVVFSPDGKRIISGYKDKTVKVWDAATGEEKLTLRGHENPVHSVSFSPDGKRIVSRSRNSVKMWNADTGHEVMTFHTHVGVSTAPSPDGKRIVSGGWDGTVRVWDAVTGNEVMTLSGHEGNVYGVAFNSDGTRIVSGSHDTTVKVWDAATGGEVMTLRGHQGYVNGVSFSPDGKRIVSGSSDNTAKVWDATTGAEVMTLRGHGDRIQSVAFSSDGTRVISASFDKTIKMWDAAIDHELTTLHAREHVCSVAVSPDGRWIGSVGKTVKLWQVASGAEVMTLRCHGDSSNSPWMPVASMAFSRDSKRIISSSWDKNIKIYDVTTGDELMTLCGHQDTVCSVAVALDGRRIASGSFDSTVKVWDAVDGADVMTLRGHDDDVYSVAFSPDGQRIVSGSKDKTVRVWDVANGEEMMILRGHAGGVHSVAFSSAGERIVSGSGDKTIKIWDANTGVELMTLQGHRDGVTCVAFSPDSKRLVSGSSYSGEIKMWDVRTGVEVVTLHGHGPWLKSIAFSPDGDYLVSGGMDQPIRLWESSDPPGGYAPRRTAAVARKVVDDLYEAQGLYSSVIKRLTTDETLDAGVRKVALQIANARLWEDIGKGKEAEK